MTSESSTNIPRVVTPQLLWVARVFFPDRSFRVVAVVCFQAIFQRIFNIQDVAFSLQQIRNDGTLR